MMLIRHRDPDGAAHDVVDQADRHQRNHRHVAPPAFYEALLLVTSRTASPIPRIYYSPSDRRE